MKYIILIIGLLFFGGCARNYDISPQYDKNSKVLHIGKYIAFNVDSIYDNTNTLLSGTTAISIRKNTFIGEDKCTHIQYVNKNISSSGIHFTSPAYVTLQSFLKTKCKDDNVGNIHFLTCGYSWYITSSGLKEGGYDDLKTYQVNKECFDDIYNFYKNIQSTNNNTNSSIQNINMTADTSSPTKIIKPYYIQYPLINEKHKMIFNISANINGAKKNMEMEMKINTKKTLLSPNLVNVVSSVFLHSNNIQNIDMEAMYTYKVNLNTKKIFDTKFISNINESFKNIDLIADEKILLNILKNGIKTGTVVAVFNLSLEENKHQIKYRVLGIGKYKGKKALVAKADKNISQELLKIMFKNNVNKLSKHIKLKDNISILYLDPNTLKRLNRNMYFKMSANFNGNSFTFNIKVIND